jgi:hypothetical protein
VVYQLAMRHLNRHESLQLLVVGEVDEAEAALPQDPFDPVSANAARMPGTCLRCQFRLLGGGVANLPGLGFSRLPKACFRRNLRRRIRVIVRIGHKAINPEKGRRL